MTSGGKVRTVLPPLNEGAKPSIFGPCDPPPFAGAFSCINDMLPARLLIIPLTLLFSGCSVIAVADAAVSVAATTVKVGATVIETTVDVAAAGVRAVLPKEEKKD